MYAYIIPVEQSLIELVLPVLLTSISGFICWNVHISLYIRVSDGFYPRNIEHRVLKCPQTVDNVCIYNTCRTKFDRISTSGVINFDIICICWNVHISPCIWVSDGFYPRHIQHRAQIAHDRWPSVGPPSADSVGHRRQPPLAQRRFVQRANVGSPAAKRWCTTDEPTVARRRQTTVEPANHCSM